ncbi:hypothetical protein KAW65_04960 [candidate division WOR-3 bacterium]|nr:hypothetical protein [candidate division WOR-3 bacterium]
MAKYTGSILGTITGRLGEFVCQRGIGGVKIVKIYRKPKDVGPLKSANSKKLTLKAIHRINSKIIFSFVHELFSKESLIKQIWEMEVRERKLALMGRNLFHKYNTGVLNKSIKDKTKLCGPDNPIDTSQMMVSEGILETPIITNVNYDKKTNVLNLKWYFDPTRPEFFEDDAHIFIIHWKIPPVRKWNIIKPWETVKAWLPEINVKRKDGELAIKLKSNLNPKYSSIHLFFTNNKSQASFRPVPIPRRGRDKGTGQASPSSSISI